MSKKDDDDLVHTAVARFACERALRLNLRGGKEPRTKHQRVVTALAALVAWHDAEPADHYGQRVTAAFGLLKEIAPDELARAYKVMEVFRTLTRSPAPEAA